MNTTIQNLMRAATRLTQSGRLHEATQAIQRALSGALQNNAPTHQAEEPVHEAKSRVKPKTKSKASSVVLDDCVFEIKTPRSASSPASATEAFRAQPAAATSRLGEFISGTHTQSSRTCRYKLYIPPGAAGRQLPLVVMLHGCTQNPDDFAAGTGMNEKALKQGFFVLYPEQAQDVNPQRCWNWFKHNHQKRGGGEPALIASMTQAVMKQHGIDPRRVYIAGLSAGGAMSAIVAAAYPEIFAAVGVHSGLPSGAASSMQEAMSVMQSGVTGQGFAVMGRSVSSEAASKLPLHSVPTIVFHGDEDRTVHSRNGEQVIAALLDSTLSTVHPKVEQGVSPQGRRYTRSIHHGDKGQAIAEHWLVHGAGHAWSGGHAEGSYTDVKGPDASGEMVRFFLEHPHNLPC